MATTLFLSCVYRSKTAVVLPRFEPEMYLSLVVKYKVEKLHVAPPLVLFLAQHPLVGKYDLSHVKLIGCGGAPLGVEVEEMAEKRLHAKVLQGFGMSELGGASTYSTQDAKRLGSAGKLIPNMDMKVVCVQTGAELSPNEHGELLFRTRHPMDGYLNEPDETKVVFTQDGFLRSGDVGYIDENGFVFLVDRIKELIKYKGHQVAPAELEDVLNSHPSVADSCCVRGFDVKTWEEIPKAFVVLRNAMSAKPVTTEEPMEYVAGKVAPIKKVRAVEFTDSIPRSLSGEIIRRELQAKEDKQVALAKAWHSPHKRSTNSMLM
ncbi:4-coumarate-coa ligase, partial [Globisporangium splendens]